MEEQNNSFQKQPQGIKSQNYIKHVWSVGSGSSGVLLSENLDDVYIFQQQKNISKKFDGNLLTEISYDGMMAVGKCISKEDNNQIKIYRWGECSLLPNETKKKDIYINPRELILDPKFQIDSIECGWQHAILFNRNIKGAIFGLGSNQFGELGLGQKQKKFINEPVQILEFQNKQIEWVVCGFRQSYIKISGEQNGLYVTGQNKSFELGLDMNKKENKILYEFQLNEELFKQRIQIQDQQEQINVCDIQKMKTGYKFACFLNSKNELYAWGDNKYKQIYNNQEITVCQNINLIRKNVKDFSLGWNHIMALLNDGNIYLRGRNDMGQLGVAQQKQNVDKNQNQNIFTENLINANDVTNRNCKNKEENIIDISCGSECSYFLTNKKRVFAWGWNEHGNLGNGNLENLYSPEEINIQFDQKNDSSHEDFNPTQIYAKGAICLLL